MIDMRAVAKVVVVIGSVVQIEASLWVCVVGRYLLSDPQTYIYVRATIVKYHASVDQKTLSLSS